MKTSFLKRRWIALLILFTVLVITVVTATWIISVEPKTWKPEFDSGKTKIHLANFEVDYASPKNWTEFQNELINKLEFLDENDEDVGLAYGTDFAVVFRSMNDGTYYYGEQISGLSPVYTYVIGSTYTLSIGINNLDVDKYELDSNYTDSNNSNLVALVKYKTVQVGNTVNYDSGTWYTIEEAFANVGNNGTIVLAGSDTSGAAQTSFSALDPSITGYAGTIADGKINYTLDSGKKFRVPYDNFDYDYDGKNGTDHNGVTVANTVYSVLVIPSKVQLNVAGTLMIGGVVAHSGSVQNRGVVMNEGIINVTGEVDAYGYLKSATGTGKVILNSGAKAIDVLKMFDWMGGSNGWGVANTKAIFPINAYSIHNISCETVIYAGSSYSAYWAVSMNVPDSYAALLGSVLWQTGTGDKSFNLIGNSNASNTLFKLSDGYIVKKTNGGSDAADNSATPTINTTRAGYLTSTTGSNQTEGQFDVLEVYGALADGTVSIAISFSLVVINISIPMNTNTSLPLPIGFMDIVIGNDSAGNVGNVTLSNSSYKFMPGSSLTVKEGANLKVDGNATLFFYTYDTCDSDESYEYVNGSTTTTNSSYKFTNGHCKNKVDAKFIVNGTATINGNLGGTVLTEGSTGELIINGNASGTITHLTYLEYGGGSSAADTNTAPRTLNARGNIARYRIDFTQDIISSAQNLSRTTYIAKNGIWVADGAITISVVYNGEVILSKQSNDNSGLQLTEEEIAQISSAKGDDYEFIGLFFNDDENRIEVTTDTVFYTSVTLEAEYSYSGYTVIYDANGGSFNGSSQYIDGFKEFKSELIDDEPTREGHTFDGWYSKEDFNTQVTLLTEEMFVDNSLTLYAKWTVNIYTIKVENNNTTASISYVLFEGDEPSSVNSEGFIPYGAIVTVKLEAASGYKDPKISSIYPEDNIDLHLEISDKGSGEFEFKMPACNITISTSADSDSCFAEGTLINMADGTMKPIEEIQIGDLVLAWDFVTGSIISAPVDVIWYHGTTTYEIINLVFENGTEMRIIASHDFFDYTLNSFVLLNGKNYADYFNHEFVVYDNNGGYTTTKLIDAYMTHEEVGSYALITAFAFNVFAEDMLTMTPEDVWGIYVPFEIGENLKYDEVKMQADIEMYGLYIYEEWAEYLTYEEFVAFNGWYFKILVGKGIITEDEIIQILKNLREFPEIQS